MAIKLQIREFQICNCIFLSDETIHLWMFCAEWREEIETNVKPS